MIGKLLVLRAIDFDVQNERLTTCWVNVDAPCEPNPPVVLATAPNKRLQSSTHGHRNDYLCSQDSCFHVFGTI